jgi:thiol:disulfide interchange protein DsbA
MKRYFLVILLWTLTLPALAAEPQAGRDYLVLPVPQPVETGAKIELREFFWYGCPACYALEAPLNAYVNKLPANVAFVRTPGVAPNWIVHAKAYYAFEALGVTDKLHGPFFDAIHTRPKPKPPEEKGFFAFLKKLFGSQPKAPPGLDSETGIAAFAAEHGIDPAQFTQAFNSFGVNTRLERARQQNIGFMVEGVPALVVDGRYLTSPSRAGGEQAALRVVDFLIQKAAKERKK